MLTKVYCHTNPTHLCTKFAIFAAPNAYENKTADNIGSRTALRCICRCRKRLFPRTVACAGNICRISWQSGNFSTSAETASSASDQSCFCSADQDSSKEKYFPKESIQIYFLYLRKGCRQILRQDLPATFSAFFFGPDDTIQAPSQPGSADHLDFSMILRYIQTTQPQMFSCMKVGIPYPLSSCNLL